MKTSELIFLLPMNVYLYLASEACAVCLGEWNFRPPCAESVGEGHLRRLFPPICLLIPHMVAFLWLLPGCLYIVCLCTGAHSRVLL